jgi:hypothetical protein
MELIKRLKYIQRGLPQRWPAQDGQPARDCRCRECEEARRMGLGDGYTTREVANGLMQMASARPSMRDFFPSDAQLTPDNAYQSLVIRELVDIRP